MTKPFTDRDKGASLLGMSLAISFLEYGLLWVRQLDEAMRE